jgi:Fur family transcriptional regulator, ferric uptake regulator
MEKRNTKQKTAIRDAFLNINRPLSPEEALLEAQQYHSGLGIATVYRNIQLLIEEGWLQPVEMPGESTRYEVAGKAHHHHFRCNHCKRLYEIEGCIASFKPKLPRGFHTTGHEFFLYGICANCSADH